jgi:hypothetical protein
VERLTEAADKYNKATEAAHLAEAAGGLRLRVRVRVRVEESQCPARVRVRVRVRVRAAHLAEATGGLCYVICYGTPSTARQLCRRQLGVVASCDICSVGGFMRHNRMCPF